MLDPLIKEQIIGKSYAELTPELQQTLANALRPSGSFTEEQRSLLQGIYLQVDDLATLEALNQQSSAFQVGAIEFNEAFYVPADLLTDCRAGETYSHARNWLLNLKFAYLEIPVEIL